MGKDTFVDEGSQLTHLALVREFVGILYRGLPEAETKAYWKKLTYYGKLPGYEEMAGRTIIGLANQDPETRTRNATLIAEYSDWLQFESYDPRKTAAFKAAYDAKIASLPSADQDTVASLNELTTSIYNEIEKSRNRIRKSTRSGSP